LLLSERGNDWDIREPDKLTILAFQETQRGWGTQQGGQLAGRLRGRAYCPALQDISPVEGSLSHGPIIFHTLFFIKINELQHLELDRTARGTCTPSSFNFWTSPTKAATCCCSSKIMFSISKVINSNSQNNQIIKLSTLSMGPSCQRRYQNSTSNLYFSAKHLKYQNQPNL